MIKDEDCHGDWFACSFKEPIAETKIKVSGTYVTPDGVARDVEAERKATIKDPAIERDVFGIGATRVANGFLELGPTGNRQGGIEWEASVKTPDEFSIAGGGPGVFAFTQIIVPYRVGEDAFGHVFSCLYGISAGVTYLGGDDPNYTDSTIPADGQHTETYDDTPGQPLGPGVVRYTVADVFDLHLMYLPPGYGSQWVSLKNHGWSWGGTAYLSGFAWHLAGGYATVNSSNDFPWQPNWTDYLLL